MSILRLCIRSTTYPIPLGVVKVEERRWIGGIKRERKGVSN